MTDERSTEMMKTLPASSYVDPAAFETERGAIFWNRWMVVGRAEALEAPGAYLRTDVVGASIIVVRDRGGRLHAFHNVCRHRGSELVDSRGPVPDGSASSGVFKGSIRCPYHAWVYGLDGKLRSAPFLKETDGLRREQLGLKRVAVDSWGGFILVNLGETPLAGAPDRTPVAPLADQLGEAVERVANYPLEQLRTGASIVYDVEANWKVIVENYNECYHCGPVHPELCELVPAFKQEGGRELAWDEGIPHRDGATTFTFSGTTDRAPFEGLTEQEKVRHKGELLYPNLMLSLSADHVAAFTLWPVDARNTRIVMHLLFSPEEMARPSFDASDAAGFWDLVNRQDWDICGSVQRGMASPSFDHGYYAPMEDGSLDIRRYLSSELGPSSRA